MIIKKQLVNTFIELVKIDSPSGEEQKIAAYIIKYLKKLKLKPSKDRYGNVIVSVPGYGKPVLLSAHMDTVEPGVGIKPIVKGDVIRSDGTTVLGADDKAGIAIILETVKLLRSKMLNHRALELVFTRQEEVGLLGANNLNYKKITAREGLLFDGDGAPIEFTIAAPFIYNMDICVKGKAAHSGMEPEKGINAIAIASKAIAEIKQGRINANTTVNIGKIEGGIIRNSVPAEVNILAEARSHKQEQALKQVDIINKAFKKVVRAGKGKLVFKNKLICHGYSYKRNEPILKDLAKIAKSLKLKPRYAKIGGYIDANVYAAKNIKSINISCGVQKAHTVSERIKISHMLKIADFLLEFVKKTS